MPKPPQVSPQTGDLRESQDCWANQGERCQDRCISLLLSAERDGEVGQRPMDEFSRKVKDGTLGSLWPEPRAKHSSGQVLGSNAPGKNDSGHGARESGRVETAAPHVVFLLWYGHMQWQERKFDEYCWDSGCYERRKRTCHR
jgi:hypothetical protein